MSFNLKSIVAMGGVLAITSVSVVPTISVIFNSVVEASEELCDPEALENATYVYDQACKSIFL